MKDKKVSIAADSLKDISLEDLPKDSADATPEPTLTGQLVRSTNPKYNKAYFINNDGEKCWVSPETWQNLWNSEKEAIKISVSGITTGQTWKDAFFITNVEAGPKTTGHQPAWLVVNGKIHSITGEVWSCCGFSSNSSPGRPNNLRYIPKQVFDLLPQSAFGEPLECKADPEQAV